MSTAISKEKIETKFFSDLTFKGNSIRVGSQRDLNLSRKNGFRGFGESKPLSTKKTTHTVRADTEIGDIVENKKGVMIRFSMSMPKCLADLDKIVFKTVDDAKNVLRARRVELRETKVPSRVQSSVNKKGGTSLADERRIRALQQTKRC